MKIKGIPPVIGSNARLLILGTIIGGESHRLSQYYADSKNQFWTIIARLFKISRRSDYNKRCQELMSHGIALWDVLHHCEKDGVSNNTIKKPVANDFSDFYKQHPNIARVFFNGAGTKKYYDNLVLPQTNLHPDALISLPSTSGAYPMKRDKKIDLWRVVQNAVEETRTS